MKWHGGKGSAVRPVDKQKYDENFEKIFGKKKVSEGDEKEEKKDKKEDEKK
jgi:hypothetical protein